MKAVQNILMQAAFWLTLFLYLIGISAVTQAESQFWGYAGGLLSGVTLGLITFLVQREYSRLDEVRRDAQQAIRDFLLAHSALAMAATSGEKATFRAALERACATEDILLMLSDGRLGSSITVLRITAKKLQYVHDNQAPALAETHDKWERQQRQALSDIRDWLSSIG